MSTDTSHSIIIGTSARSLPCPGVPLADATIACAYPSTGDIGTCHSIIIGISARRLPCPGVPMGDVTP